jgi:tRNA (adenine22-N1)-methyltransferase
MIADCVEKGVSVADIGTDHAFLPAYLVEKGISDNIIASDISQGPVDNANKTIEGLGLGNQVSTVQAPGLEGLEEPIDVIIIAGMGGIVIAEIIKDRIGYAHQAKQLILQPMSSSIDLREFLYKNRFTIIEEKVALEGEKFYEIIIVKSGQEVVIEDELYFEVSSAIRKNRDLNTRKFIDRKIEVTERIIEQIRKNSEQFKEESMKELEIRLEKLKEVAENANQF